MICRKCNATLTQDAEFCAKCGTKAVQQNTVNESANQYQPNEFEKMTKMSAEKWKELSPKAKQAASVAGEKASAVSKDIFNELKQSGVAFRQAIDENKGDGTETKARIIEKAATSFFSKLSGKQKAILAGAAMLLIVMVFGLFGGNSEFDEIHEMTCKLRDLERGKLSPKEAEELAIEMASSDVRERLQAKYKGKEAELEKKMLEVLSKGC